MKYVVAGCSKRSRDEARENRSFDSAQDGLKTYLPYVAARRLSATTDRVKTL
jgi:hypothetical protein